MMATMMFAVVVIMNTRKEAVAAMQIFPRGVDINSPLLWMIGGRIISRLLHHHLLLAGTNIITFTISKSMILV